MGTCSSSSREEKFKKLYMKFLSEREKSQKRIFTITISSKYEDVCDDVICAFQMKGWIITQERDTTFLLKLPPKKEVYFS